MGWLVVIVIVWIVVSWLNRSSDTTSRTQDGGRIPGIRTKPQSSSTYRPTARNAKPSSIKFGLPTAAQGGGSTRAASDLGGISDAFTGRQLDLSQPIYECANCHVYYQAGSVDVLREANSSRCMACGSTQITQFGEGRPNVEARNYTPDVVTLQTYRQHIGHVITFTGYVQEVKRSRRGADFAVMFEKASWTKGLKMVAFRGGVRKIGGEAKLLGYAGKTITIRGLLIHDPTFGPEIIVDDPSMILQVQP